MKDIGIVSNAKETFRQIVDPNYPLLEANRARIESTERRTYVYGPTEAHQLHLYFPPPQTGFHHPPIPPILVFIHGGGFIRGSLSHPPTHLIHANLGAYFAQKRILTIIVTYRLLPNVIFPGGSEDIRDALHWIVDNLKDEGDVTNITVLGHSAGGVHLSGVLLLPSLCTEKIKGCVKGVIFVGVPFEVGGGLDSEYRKNAEMYYGGVKKIGDRQPMGLLRRLERDHVERLPKIWNVVAEREPRRVASSAKRFSELVRAKLRSGDQEFRSQSPSDEKTRCDQRDQAQKIDDVVLEGHDHVSPIVSLSTGNERLEKWGLDVVNWVFELASCTTPTGGVHTEGFR